MQKNGSGFCQTGRIPLTAVGFEPSYGPGAGISRITFTTVSIIEDCGTKCINKYKVV